MVLQISKWLQTIQYYFDINKNISNSLNLIFPNRLSDNSNVFNGETGVFTAPVGGRYSIGLYLQVFKGSGGYYNNLYMKRNGSTVHYIYTSGTPNNGSQFDHRYYQVEIELNKGETAAFNMGSHSSGLSYDPDTYIEGKLVKAN